MGSLSKIYLAKRPKSSATGRKYTNKMARRKYTNKMARSSAARPILIAQDKCEQCAENARNKKRTAQYLVAGVFEDRGLCFWHYSEAVRQKRIETIGSDKFIIGKVSMATCQIDECTQAVHAKGLCKIHYDRARRKKEREARAVEPPDQINETTMDGPVMDAHSNEGRRALQNRPKD